MDTETQLRIAQRTVADLHAENDEQRLYINHLLSVRKQLIESIDRLMDASEAMAEHCARLQSARMIANTQPQIAEASEKQIATRFTSVTIGEDGRHD